MPTYDAILVQDTQFLTVPMEVSRATHFPLILAPNIAIPITALIDTGQLTQQFVKTSCWD